MTEIGANSSESVLVLQGGGALGSYQAGVFEALAEFGQQADWVSGISIGAINSAIIAGNPPELRVERLKEFWQTVSSGLPAPMWPVSGELRAQLHQASASHVMMFGVPGFFSPRFPPAPFRSKGTMEAISYYDTASLKGTLERLVDFDQINAGPVRLSVGAVNVRTGNFTWFDSATQVIDARHIMASGALPPAFAPVEIDGEHYWDGGLVSNTPLQYVLDKGKRGTDRVVFQVDLFPARGPLPTTLGEAAEREKDIRFSSRTRRNTTLEVDRQMAAKAAQRLIAKLPAELREDPDVQVLERRLRSECTTVDVVHLIYRSRQYESQAKDYEFSRLTMQEHWQAGYDDMRHSLLDSRWVNRGPTEDGVRVFDLTLRRQQEARI
jgi:NTE family protein